MSVGWRPDGARDGGGLVLLHCHGCEATSLELAESLGLTPADLFDEPLQRREPSTTRSGRSVTQRKSGARRGKLGRLPAPITRRKADPADDVTHVWTQVDTYVYVDVHGAVVEEVIREECTACGDRHKQFRQEFARPGDGQRVRRKPDGFTPVLYRLPEVLAAVATGVPVWLVEGEKDVHSAEQAGLVATTNAQGGHGFPADLIEVLRGAEVHVVLDRDGTGWDRGVALHRLLTDVDAVVTLHVPAVETPKADLTDHVEAGYSIEQLLRVCLDEVTAWSAVAALEHKLRAVQLCVDEVDAHQQAALSPAADDKLGAEEHQLRARRWAVESELRFEAVRDLLDDVRRAVGPSGSAWAGQALAEAARMHDQARNLGQQAHELVAIAVPPALQPPALPTPDHDDTKDADSSVGDVHGGSIGAGDTSGGDTGGASDALDGPVEIEWGVRRNGAQRNGPVRGSGATVVEPNYRIIGDAIVQVDTSKRRDEDDDSADIHKLVLGLAVQIVEMEYLEDPDTVDVEKPVLLGRDGREELAKLNPPAPPVLAAVTVRYSDPATGEDMHLRILADEYQTGQWLESLPGPPAYDSKPSGMARVRDALKAVSPHIASVTRFRGTGWRHDAPSGSWMFVHGGGGITAHRNQPVRVTLDGPLRRLDLPDPTRDPAVLREAFLEHSAGMLTRLPGRVAAPLLGHVYRSALGRSPFVAVLVGRKASFKTALAALTMHHWGEMWDRDKPAASMSGNGDTFNAIRIKLNSAKDTMFWADDVAPTKDWAAAQKLLEEFARLVHNAEQRSRSTRDGLSVLDGTPPRTSALVTSEVMPRPGSGADRMLPIPLEAGQIDLEQIKWLDQMPVRFGRAQLMSSFLSWLAADLHERRQRFLHDEADRYADSVRDTDGVTDRQAEAVGDYWAGWAAMLAFLVEVEAITAEEAATISGNVDTHLREALAATHDPDVASSVGGRLRELIGHALRTQLAYVEDVRTGSEPPWPLASRLGWRRQPIGYDQVTQEVKHRYEPRGLRLGYVMHDPGARDGDCAQIYAEKEGLEQLLKDTAGKMTDGLQVDIGTTARMLCDEGVLVPEISSSGAKRYTVKRTVHCENGRSARFYVLRLHRLFGDDDDGQQQLEPLPVGDDDSAGAKPSYPKGSLLTPAGTAAVPTRGVDSSQQPGLASGAPQQGLTSPPFEEPDNMPEPTPEDLGPETFLTADGVAGEAAYLLDLADDDLPACLFCEGPSMSTIAGRPAHATCWQASTAESRAAAAARARGGVQQQLPAATETKTAAPAPADKRTGTPSASASTVKTPRSTSTRTTAATTRATKPGSAAAAGQFAAPAAVLHTDGIWMPDGSRHDRPADLRHVGQLAEIVQQLNLGTQVTRFRSNPGQLWVTAEVTEQLGVDLSGLGEDPTKWVPELREATAGTPLVDEAIAAGWSIGGHGDRLNAWTRVWRTDSDARGPWIVLIPGLNPDPLVTPVLGDDPSPATLARRLGLFADALKAPWALSGSTTGLNLLTDLKWKDRDRLLAAREPVPPATDATLEADFNWSRKPTAEESTHRYVHAYDRGGSYAAGLAGLEVGIGDAVHHRDGTGFDPKLPGYWLVEVPQAGDWRLPYLLRPRSRTGSLPAKPIWVTTPTMTLAHELGYELPALEAYVWPEHGRVFDGWYERVRDARTGLDIDDEDAQIARDQLKIVYTRTIGMMGSEEYMVGKAGYAPERRHLIVSKARNNILRRILQIGAAEDRWPVAVMADTIVYTSDDPDPVSAWPGKAENFGRGLGQFKPEASGLLVDQLEHLTGDGWRGKRHMTGIAAPDGDNGAADVVEQAS